MAPRVTFSIARAAARLGVLSPLQYRSKAARVTPTDFAIASRVRRAESIHLESAFSDIRGLPRVRGFFETIGFYSEGSLMRASSGTLTRIKDVVGTQQ
jgi:hypothetical protein